MECTREVSIFGLQATVGTLVAKTLTSSSQNPYQAGQIARSAAAGTPAALDAFSIQVQWILGTTHHRVQRSAVATNYHELACMENGVCVSCGVVNVFGRAATLSTLPRVCTATSCSVIQGSSLMLSYSPCGKWLHMQASTNTVLAHFASIVFANMMMRLLNKSAAQQTKTA
jgi:hypothetical protein